MKVNVTRSPAVAFSSPRTVCELPKNIYRSFDISPDGNKILIGITHSPSASATEVYVVVGWFNELKQKFLTATSK
jgi:hypothetical protein